VITKDGLLKNIFKVIAEQVQNSLSFRNLQKDPFQCISSYSFLILLLVSEE